MKLEIKNLEELLKGFKPTLELIESEIELELLKYDIAFIENDVEVLLKSTKRIEELLEQLPSNTIDVDTKDITLQ